MYINPKNNGGSGINRMDNNSHSGNYDKTRLTYLGPQTHVYTMTHHKILCLVGQVLSIDTLRYDWELTVMMTMIKQNEILQFLGLCFPRFILKEYILLYYILSHKLNISPYLLCLQKNLSQLSFKRFYLKM